MANNQSQITNDQSFVVTADSGTPNFGRSIPFDASKLADEMSHEIVGAFPRRLWNHEGHWNLEEVEMRKPGTLTVFTDGSTRERAGRAA